MRWALHNKIRILPNPLIKDAKCPSCNMEVIPKCGNIKGGIGLIKMVLIVMIGKVKKLHGI